MIKELEKAIAEIAKKAAEATDSGDAMRFAQAASNLANTAANIKHYSKPE